MQQNKFVTSLNLSYLIRRRHISKMPRFQSKSHALITRDQPKIAPMSYHKNKFQNGGKSGKMEYIDENDGFLRSLNALNNYFSFFN